jgi:hypothetical protein
VFSGIVFRCYGVIGERVGVPEIRTAGLCPISMVLEDNIMGCGSRNANCPAQVAATWKFDRACKKTYSATRSVNSRSGHSFRKKSVVH